jgi:hypothetical protein
VTLGSQAPALHLANQDLEQVLRNSIEWLASRDYSGYEPYDILNSPYLAAGILRRPPLSFALIQFGRRLGGMGLRRLLKVPASKNPKALGLILAAIGDLTHCGGEYRQQAVYLKSELKRLRSPSEPEYCWGYDWDYMSLRGTKLPAFSPNCIASYFCGDALLDMAESCGDVEAAQMAESVGRFIVTRLNRSVDTADRLCFSYTPSDRTLIYNNSALAGAYLARLASRRNNADYLSLARRVMNYLASEQLPDGGWYYGVRRRQRWIDGFHTSYNLCALLQYRNCTRDGTFDDCIGRGHAYYSSTFFDRSGAPKYFHNRLHPIDIHSCSQAILHFCAFADEDPSALGRALAMYRWTQENMTAEDGSYYFQRHRTWTNRTPYIRWGQAWMFRALTRLQRTVHQQESMQLADLPLAAGRN